MKICLIAEGCYPYVAGGVSAWIQMLMEGMPEHQFVICTIAASTQQKGRFKYRLPANVAAVEENFLDQIPEPPRRRTRRAARSSGMRTANRPAYSGKAPAA